MTEIYYAIIAGCLLTIAFFAGALWQIRRTRRYLVEYRDVNAQIVEVYKSAIDTLTERAECQRAIIESLTAPETCEFDAPEKFN